MHVIHVDQQLSAAFVYERSALIRYATLFSLQHSPLTPCMPIFTRKADGITARSPKAKRESLSVRPSCSHEDVQAVHQIVEAIAPHEYLAVNLLRSDAEPVAL